MYIKGKYDRKLFRSDATGFTVGIILIKESDISEKEKIIFTGYFPEIIEGENYLLNGELVEHNKYGLQFSVKSYEKVKIETKEKLIEYLSSDLFPGIGKKIAQKIVDHFGIEAIDKIILDKNNLLVLNIPIKKINILYENLIKYEESHNIIVYLSELGFNTKDALKIYSAYGKNTVLHMENNIYSLIDDVSEMSFLKIDRLAEKFNISKTDPNRIEAGIVYAIKEYTFNTGDTFVGLEILAKVLFNILAIEIPNLEDYMDILEQDMRVIRRNDKYYLYDYYNAEENIRDFILELKRKKPYIYKNLEEKIELLEEKYNINYNESQKEAIIKGLTSHILVITGGPGVGKTTIIKAITELFMEYEENSNAIALLAPTGRASKRLSETTRMVAMTIHRFLKWNKETDQFMMNEGNKSDVKYVIVDESSMVDLLLFDNLLKALKSNVRIIVVGDHFQLPSVSPGQVLKDIIESEELPVIHLNVLYRQKKDSFIPTLASYIKEGMTDEIFINHYDYEFLETPPYQILDEVVELVKKLIANGKNYFDFQVMAPIYKGESGIDNLNKALQNICNPQTAKYEIKFFDTVFRVSDKVIQLVNVPDENIYNGDIGIIEHIVSEKISDSGKNEIYVNYEGNSVRYLPSDFNMIKHAYAISIHKSQGSEFDTVIIPVSPSYRRMLYRKLIYTGVTRAKKKLYLIGSKESFYNSIMNNSESSRKSTLKELIKENHHTFDKTS